MKYLFFALLLSSACFAQSTKPFKKANRIMVTFDTMSVNVAFEVVSQSLIAMGYTIDKADRNLQTIQTHVRDFPASFNNAPVAVLLRISLKTVALSKTEVKLSGVYGFGGETDPPMDIVYRGMSGSVFMAAFDKLQEVAKSLSTADDSKITYALY